MHASRRFVASTAKRGLGCLRDATPAVTNMGVLSSARLLHTSTIVPSKVNQDSWSAEFLEERGENLPEGTPVPATELSDEILYNPSPKVLKLADQYLACNVIEAMQVWAAIQVLDGILTCFITVQCDYSPLIQTRLGFSMEDLFAGSGEAGGGGGGGGGGAAAEAAAAEPVKEKEAFDLKLTEVPAAAKIKVIKEVRAITGLGLKEVQSTDASHPTATTCD
jgi:hypothetical protein